MTREQLSAIARKYFNEEQLTPDDKLNLIKISPLDLLDFILEVEQTEQRVIPTEKIKTYNFKDLDSIYGIIKLESLS